jgi:hypothetical protein
MRGCAQPDEEPVQPAKLDGFSMAYQLTSLGIAALALLAGAPDARLRDVSVTDAGAEALAERVCQLVATPVHEFPQIVVALAEIDTLGGDAAANAVDDRVGALEARAAEIMAVRDAGVTPGGYLVALDYLLAMMQTELSWLRTFASSLRSERVQDEVGI